MQESNISLENTKLNENTLVLRINVAFAEDDLSDEAKKQFDFHHEILRTFRFFAEHVLSNKQLSPVGRHLACTALEQNHINAKLVLNYVASHPEITSPMNALPHPLVLCGLPRSGTTLLYNLLACDLNCRAPLYSEMAQPIPPLARSDNMGQVQRNNALQGFREMFANLGLGDCLQNMRASHPQYAIEEDQYIFHHAGYSWSHVLLSPPDDNELLHWSSTDINKSFIYDYHKTFIQMLNSIDAPNSHWL
ncbi:unnamed protein product [Rotaria sp. Silwood1]|nr:unnamed protein product [Rotaria sp. Silwood1]